jgi:hypothetical protein
MNADFLMGKRKAQLDQEAHLDQHLTLDAANECPQKLTQFFLMQRSYNRYLTQKLHDAPFYSMFGIYSDNLDKMDTVQKDLLHSDCFEVCTQLDRVTKQMETAMKKDESA